MERRRETQSQLLKKWDILSFSVVVSVSGIWPRGALVGRSSFLEMFGRTSCKENIFISIDGCGLEQPYIFYKRGTIQLIQSRLELDS